jgi:ABC-2 type transport system ATP-binding protein
MAAAIAPGEPVITVSDLRMRYGSKDVLTGVDFTVDAGGVLANHGPHAAGHATPIEIHEGYPPPSGADGLVELVEAKARVIRPRLS